MRHAMATADVGDDVYGEDPTVIALQLRVADLLGVAAALWVPTGTMANQIALRAHLEPGQEVLVGDQAHCWRFESGALAALAGAQTTVLPGDGRFTAQSVRSAFKAYDHYSSTTRVVAIENTHNMAGGLVWDTGQMRNVIACARELGLATHLDGARLWNAAVYNQAAEKDLCQGFDTISVCLSKGLGAPAGSMLAGNKEIVSRCIRYRKMYGGGLRQAGILAAAGLYALDHNRQSLIEDHRRARRLAESLLDCPGASITLDNVMTNIVMIDLSHRDAHVVVAAAKERGVLIGAIHSRRIRVVTHKDVSDADIERAISALRDAIASTPVIITESTPMERTGL
jgi:threonine aldolase